MLLDRCLNNGRVDFTGVSSGILAQQKYDPEAVEEFEKKIKQDQLRDALRWQIRYDREKKRRSKHDYCPPKPGDGLNLDVLDCTCTAKEAGFVLQPKQFYDNYFYGGGPNVNRSGYQCTYPNNTGYVDQQQLYEVKVEQEYQALLNQARSEALQRQVAYVADELDMLEEQMRIRNGQLRNDITRQDRIGGELYSELRNIRHNTSLHNDYSDHYY
mmetsp:Transcript_44244/g.70721  ORF Transcript_44244/g.70721 Transcript_44244/m.70721 type:complete len:214 (+) Transcript_44244:56-697(+)